MSWQSHTIAGRPGLMRPSSDTGSDTRSAVVYLHDHDPRDLLTLDTFLPDRTLFAPLGGDSFWSDRVSPNFDSLQTAHAYLIHAVVPWVATTFPGPLAIVGTGVGGQAALRIAFQHAEQLPIVASIDGVLDLHEWHGRGTSLDQLYERREQVRQDTAVLQIRQHAYPRHIWIGCPPDSEQVRGHDRLHEKLSAVGVPHIHLFADAVSLRNSLEAFLNEAIAKQHRRLL